MRIIASLPLSSLEIWDRAPVAAREVSELLSRLGGYTLNVFLRTLPFFHYCFPKYSPFVRMQGFKDYNTCRAELQQTSPQTQVQFEEIQTKMARIAGQMGVTRPIALFVKNDHYKPIAHGSSGLPFFATPVIAVGTEILELPDDEKDIVLAHEISHVDNKDGLKMAGLLAVSMIANFLIVEMVLPALIPFFGFLATLGFFYVSMKIYCVLSIRAELRADLDAVRTTGNYDAAIRFFERMRTQNIQARGQESTLNRHLINEEGEETLNVFYPTLRERIANITDYRRQQVSAS